MNSVYTRGSVKTREFTRGIPNVKGCCTRIPGEQAHLTEAKFTRELPEEWTFLGLAFHNAPSLHTQSVENQKKTNHALEMLENQRKRDDNKNKICTFQGGPWAGGQGGKLSKTLFFYGKRHDNKILKVKMLLSRKFVVMAQTSREGRDFEDARDCSSEKTPSVMTPFSAPDLIREKLKGNS